MMAAKILISIALVFTALGLACAVWASRLAREPELGRRQRHPSAKPYFDDKHPFGYTRAELDALTTRSRARSALDPLGLRRPLFFSSVRLPSAGEADGGDQVHPGFPAVRYFRAERSSVVRLIRSDRQEAGNV
ncbi:hypothetical protein [Bradyrhizobium sp. DOA9]|uniref:hypothetical protein n=1 Tax=Bradyrhizobium sp. DOA9 TaxID=1126627 RepID=UPI00046902A1|nr:hypothetical protein [Bradyrhizobium sp. DOA9]